MKQNLRRYAIILCLISSFSIQSEAHEKFVRGCQGWGFFAEFLWVINHLDYCVTTGKVPIVYWNEHSSYYDPEGYNGSKNAWEYYFEPVSSLKYKNGDKLHVEHFYRDDFSAICSYHLYIATLDLCSQEEKNNFIHVTQQNIKGKEKYPINDKHIYNEGFRKSIKKHVIDPFITLKSSLKNKIETFYEQKMRGKKTIGIHLRGKHAYGEVPFVPIKKILMEANKHYEPGVQFFIATDQTDLIVAANKILKGDVIFYECERFSQTTAPKPGDKLHPKLGEDLIIETLLLSRCDFFVHTISNVSTAVLYFNPDLKHTVLY